MIRPGGPAVESDGLWKAAPSPRPTFPQALENGAPSPFTTATHSHDDEIHPLTLYRGTYVRLCF